MPTTSTHHRDHEVLEAGLFEVFPALTVAQCDSSTAVSRVNRESSCCTRLFGDDILFTSEIAGYSQRRKPDAGARTGRYSRLHLTRLASAGRFKSTWTRRRTRSQSESDPSSKKGSRARQSTYSSMRCTSPSELT